MSAEMVGILALVVMLVLMMPACTNRHFNDVTSGYRNFLPKGLDSISHFRGIQHLDPQL